MSYSSTGQRQCNTKTLRVIGRRKLLLVVAADEAAAFAAEPLLAGGGLPPCQLLALVKQPVFAVRVRSRRHERARVLARRVSHAAEPPQLGRRDLAVAVVAEQRQHCVVSGWALDLDRQLDRAW